MATTWKGRDWAVAVSVGGVAVQAAGQLTTIDASDSRSLTVARPWFRWKLRQGTRTLCTLSGLARADVNALRVALRRVAVGVDLAAAVEWAAVVDHLLGRSEPRRRWIPHEEVARLVDARPSTDLPERIRADDLFGVLTATEQAAVELIGVDLHARVAALNEQIAVAELLNNREFFDRIEKSPLTDEQAKAVVCFDNRVQVVAAAGSGKTSVMVARSAYAIHRQFTAPERILLLAFNKDAADELETRIEQRLANAGIESTGLRASTFHAFGLDVIAKATNAKPKVAPWVDNGGDIDHLEGIVDDLRDRSEGFRMRWDLYRLLFAGVPENLAEATADSYDRATATTGFATLKGDIVKSAGERIIADWLFLNCVNYQYERPFTQSTATATHSQYHPDFYYPDVDTWHEHWALGRDGKPPAAFVGYGAGIDWKRELHSDCGTDLIETTWAGVMYGDDLSKLKRELTSRGITLDWNPDRPTKTTVVEHQALVKLMRAFLTHIKSNALDRSSVKQRLETSHRRYLGFRTKLFLELFWPIHDEWNRQLRDGNYVDFEDMLGIAAEHIEAGNYISPFELVMVDELQDASPARARLVNALLQQPDRYLLAVGDDWQSINRFAGADLSVMTDFHDIFGPGPTLQLTTTFRSPQTICDVTSAFISKNSRQLRKQVESSQTDPGEPVTVVVANDVRSALTSCLGRLSEQVAAGNVEPTGGDKVTVDVLVRYNFDRALRPETLPANLVVTFRTAHKSKGLEADYVIVPRVSAGRYGFPSEIVDDPVLDVAMSEPDAYSHAEERRLFYVALTRARRHVTVITERGKESAFVTELLSERPGLVEHVGDEGEEICPVVVCDGCHQGTMVQRTGKHGPLFGCSRFPKCANTTQTLPAAEATVS